MAYAGLVAIATPGPMLNLPERKSSHISAVAASRKATATSATGDKSPSRVHGCYLRWWQHRRVMFVFDSKRLHWTFHATLRVHSPHPDLAFDSCSPAL